MSESSAGRVAVYLDFDNIVMSWYDRVHGRNTYARDRQRIAENPTEPEIAERLARATIDVGAIIDYAASLGTLVLTRAYADWSSPVNAIYRSQLVARAVDLVQLFPAAAYAKNGADIRLAVDTVEDMFRLPDLTHVVIVAGDSDYVPLAQRCRRLGRYVIGVGVAGSTAKSLAAACDEFEAYDSLPGVEPIAPRAPRTGGRGSSSAPVADAAAAADEKAPPAEGKGSGRGSGRAAAKTAAPAEAPDSAADADAAPAAPKTRSRRVGTKTTTPEPAAEAAAAEAESRPASAPRARRPIVTSLFLAPDAGFLDDGDDDEDDATPAEDPQDAATRLLERALRLGHDKDDAEWLHSSAVKTHMRRMDPSFSEKALGYKTFSDFVKTRGAIAELEETGHERLVRLVPARR